MKSKFLKLNCSHIEYVMGCMEKNTTKVCNIKGYLIATRLNVRSTIEDKRDMFRKSFAFYTIISADKNQINRSFDTTAIDSIDFAKIRRDLVSIISKKDNFQLEERKNHTKQYISDLMQLTEKENEYMDRFMMKEYCPELLFDDEKIVARTCEHSMALWKCKQ